MIGKTVWTGLTAGMFVAVLMADRTQAADFNFVHASLNPEKHIDYPVNMDFVNRVKKYSGGKIDFKVFAGGVLGDEREMVEQLKSGNISTARITPAILGSICPGQMILNLPFLFNGGEHMMKVVHDKKFNALCEGTFSKAGLRVLDYWWLGVRDLYTKTPVKKVEDVAGLKLRTWQDASVVASWKALKAIPTPISFSELYTSLQTGVVDGAEGWLASYNGRSFYEVAPYVTVIGYINIASAVIISEKAWSKLPADLQAAVKKAATENAEFAFKTFKDQEAGIYERAKQNGKGFYRVDDIKKWQDMTAPVIDEFGKKYGAEYAKVLDWVKATR